MPDLLDLLALPSGCLVRTQRAALLIPRSGPPRQLAADATAVSHSGGAALVATPREVIAFDPRGRRTGGFRTGPGVSALARIGERIALGHQDGNIELRSTIPGAHPVSFERVPASPVVRLLAGPGATVVAGFANGVVGLWSAAHGKALETLRLHGPIRFLELRGEALHAVTELGDHQAIDVSHYLESYCAVLRRVWSEVPVVWDEGQVLLRPPPKAHACTR